MAVARDARWRHGRVVRRPPNVGMLRRATHCDHAGTGWRGSGAQGVAVSRVTQRHDEVGRRTGGGTSLRCAWRDPVDRGPGGARPLGGVGRTGVARSGRGGRLAQGGAGPWWGGRRHRVGAPTRARGRGAPTGRDARVGGRGTPYNPRNRTARPRAGDTHRPRLRTGGAPRCTRPPAAASPSSAPATSAPRRPSGSSRPASPTSSSSTSSRGCPRARRSTSPRPRPSSATTSRSPGPTTTPTRPAARSSS